MSIRRIGLLFIVCLVAGCSREQEAKLPFIYPKAIVTASYQSDSARINVAGNYLHDVHGKAKQYGGGAGMGNGAAEMHYEYVGTAFVPLDDFGKEFNYADVYVFRVKTATDGPCRVIPFVFKGGNEIVFDQDGLMVAMKAE